MTAPDALIFDLFGTLVFFDDSRVPTVELEGRRVPMTVRDLPGLLGECLPAVAVDDFLRTLRRESAAIWKRKEAEHVEVHTSVRFEAALAAHGAEAGLASAFARRMAAGHMDSLFSAVVFPEGRRDLLARLRESYRLALLSNFDDGATAHRILEAAGIRDLFDTIVVSDEEMLRKPSRELFERTCSRLGVEPARCLHIGDSLEHDIAGAKSAGIPSLWIHTDPEAASTALAVLDDVGSLPLWLERGLSAPGGASR